MSVCCATLLSNGLIGSAYGQARSSDPRGRACNPNGKGTGEEGSLSDVVPALFILSGLNFWSQCFSRRLHARWQAASYSPHLAPSPQAGLSDACGQGL